MADENVYSSPAQVIEFVGLKGSDFGLEDEFGEGKLTADEKLAVIVQEWLIAIKSYIDASRNRDYHAEVEAGTLTAIPPGIHNIALRAAANQAAFLVLRRQSPIVKLEDFKGDFMLKLVDDSIWSDALRRDLSLFPAKPRFRMAVMRSETTQEEEENA